MAKVKTNNATGSVELATFYIGDALCGMDILKVQEINKHMDFTRVPQAPEYVLGVHRFDTPWLAAGKFIDRKLFPGPKRSVRPTDGIPGHKKHHRRCRITDNR